MQPLISIHTWVSLSNDMRHRIRMIFNIPRSSNTVVNDGVVETDGVTNEDLRHLTIEKMQAYLNDTSTDFHKLFDLTIAKIVDDMTPKVILSTVMTASSTPIILSTVVEVPSPIKKRGRPSKK